MYVSFVHTRTVAPTSKIFSVLFEIRYSHGTLWICFRRYKRKAWNLNIFQDRKNVFYVEYRIRNRGICEYPDVGMYYVVCTEVRGICEYLLLYYIRMYTRDVCQNFEKTHQS